MQQIKNNRGLIRNLPNRWTTQLFSLLLIQLALADITVPSNSVTHAMFQAKAGLFLSQATMGYSIDEVDRLAIQMSDDGEAVALNRWIDDQFEIPSKSFVDLADAVIATDGFHDEENSQLNPNLAVSITLYQTHIWWDRIIRGDDRLRQRVTWGLSQIFVTSSNVDEGPEEARWKQPLFYYDALSENAFENYRDLLGEITYHPFMGFFLSSLKNAKGDNEAGVFADENYAREILQLFSSGVYSLDDNGRIRLDASGIRIENYSNEQITELAKVFTGLTYANPDGSIPTTSEFFTRGRNYEFPMRMVQGQHDTTEKNIFGVILPAGQDGNDDIAQSLDIISEQDSVAPFISQRLIQRFTTSNPSFEYIGRVADVWRNTEGGRPKGDMKAVIRAILMDPEARDSLTFNVSPIDNSGNVVLEIEPKDPLHGRLREPVLLLTQFFGYFKPISQEPNGTFKPFLPNVLYTNQQVMRPATVFNYYNADFQPGTGPLAEAGIASNEELFMPELELLPSTSISLHEGFSNLARSGEVYQNVTSSTVNAIMPSLNDERARSADQSALQTIERLNLFLCSGMMSDNLKNKIAAIMEDNSAGNPDERFSRIVGIILSSADYAVSH